MSALKKFTALIICIAMLCICLVSCDQILGNNQGNNQGNDQTGNDQTGNDQGNDQTGDQDNNQTGNNQGGNNQDKEELQSEYYVANITVSYTTDDDKMKAAVEAMETETVLTVMADNLKLVSNVVLSNASVSDEYTYLNGTLYHANTVKVGDMSLTSLKKASMSESQVENLLSKAGAGAGVDIGDFTKFDISKEDKITTYTCTNMTDAAKDSLTQILASKFDGLGATVEIDNASFILQVKDGRDHSTTLSCDLIIGMDGATYEVTMNLKCDYNYNAVTVIMTPGDSDKYIDSTVDEILG